MAESGVAGRALAVVKSRPAVSQSGRAAARAPLRPPPQLLIVFCVTTRLHDHTNKPPNHHTTTSCRTTARPHRSLHCRLEPHSNTPLGPFDAQVLSRFAATGLSNCRIGDRRPPFAAFAAFPALPARPLPANVRPPTTAAASSRFEYAEPRTPNPKPRSCPRNGRRDPHTDAHITSLPAGAHHFAFAQIPSFVCTGVLSAVSIFGRNARNDDPSSLGEFGRKKIFNFGRMCFFYYHTCDRFVCFFFFLLF